MDSANVGYSYHLPSGGWNNKIRNTLSQFSDLFSEFNKYIAPAYHHDRCERSVPMRVYTMHKGEFVMVIVAFLAIFGLGVFIGLAGPCPTITTTVAASSTVTNKSDIYRGVLHLHSPALGFRFQQLWLTAQIMTNNDDEEIFDKSFQISISINGVLNDHTLTTLVPASEATNKTRHLKCKEQVCKPVLVLHLGSLEFVHYVLNIQMHGLQEFHKRYFISEIFFYFKTYNPGFTQMETWFRFIFLLTTFIVTCWFAHTLKKYSSQDWAIEQKWLSMLLPLLLLFNDPIFPLRLVSAGFFAPFIDSIFQTTFMCGVMLSWLALYHGIRQNERSFLTFYLFKVLVVGGVWLPAAVLASWQRYDAFYDPTYDYTENYNYPLVRLLFFCAVAFYFLYLLVLIVKAYSDLRNMPFFEVRLRCLSLSAGSVVLLAAWLAALRWGPAALQDHWVSQPDSHYVTSAPFMALYGLFNFNMYFLAYLYSPAGGSIQDTAITKDNPAFSMINDSDEEVLYGSDEDSRRLLNAHRTVASEEI